MIDGIQLKKAYTQLRGYAKELTIFQWSIDIGRKWVTLHLAAINEMISIRIGEHSKGMKRGVYIIGNQHSYGMIAEYMKLIRKAKNLSLEIIDGKIVIDGTVEMGVVDDKFMEINILDLKDAGFKGTTKDLMTFKTIAVNDDQAKKHLHIVNIDEHGAARTDGHQLLLDRSTTSKMRVTMHGKLLGLLKLMGEIKTVTSNDHGKSLWSFENGEILQIANDRYPPVIGVIPKYDELHCEVEPKGFKQAEATRISALAEKKNTATKIFTNKDGFVCLGIEQPGHHVVMGKAIDEQTDDVWVSMEFITKMMVATKMRFALRHGNNDRNGILFKNEKYTYVAMPLRTPD